MELVCSLFSDCLDSTFNFISFFSLFISTKFTSRSLYMSFHFRWFILIEKTTPTPHTYTNRAAEATIYREILKADCNVEPLNWQMLIAHQSISDVYVLNDPFWYLNLISIAPFSAQTNKPRVCQTRVDFFILLFFSPFYSLIDFTYCSTRWYTSWTSKPINQSYLYSSWD